MNEKDKAINDLANKFLAECSEQIVAEFGNRTQIRAKVNLWIFRKLAELQLEINELKNK